MWVTLEIFLETLMKELGDCSFQEPLWDSRGAAEVDP